MCSTFFYHYFVSSRICSTQKQRRAFFFCCGNVSRVETCCMCTHGSNPLVVCNRDRQCVILHWRPHCRSSLTYRWDGSLQTFLSAPQLQQSSSGEEQLFSDWAPKFDSLCFAFAVFLDFYPNLSAAALGIIDLVVGVWVKSGPGDNSLTTCGKMQQWTRT